MTSLATSIGRAVARRATASSASAAAARRQLSAASACANPDRFASYPEKVGIVAMDAYFPRQYVAQEDLEKHDGVSAGNYTVGLGQQEMAFCTDNEDIYSVCMNAVANLMEKNGISPKDVGRLEVGTETILDHSKAVKTFLMQQFGENTDIEGVDTLNACYGGTSALLNSIQWVESSAWDGRYAIVVSADIAEYEKGPARPTGGAGAIAMLIGKDAPLAIERGARASHMEHAYDFYKPNLLSPFPVVDGKFSQSCYIRAVDLCYRRYAERFQRIYGKEFDLSMADMAIFHAPYNKLVQKSYGRLLYNDFKRFPDRPEFAALQEFDAVSAEDSVWDRALEKAFVKASAADYAARVVPGTMLPKRLGNLYTASLYAGLLSAVHTSADTMAGKRTLMFSYGSGLAATMFSLNAGTSEADVAALRKIRDNANLEERLNARIRATPEEFNAALGVREGLHSLGAFEPADKPDNLFDGAYYLERKDDLGRRYYGRR